jgi:putative two-component system response regulator
MTVRTAGCGATILVVDDERQVRRALVRILSDGGYDVTEADGAESCRAQFALRPFDLVLCDITMPGTDGLQLLAWLAERHADVGVVMVTAVADPRLAGPLSRHRALGYIRKPFDAAQILVTVATALQRRADSLGAVRDLAQLRETLAARADELSRALSELAARSTEVEQLHEESVLRLATVAEWRDACTGAHLRRISVGTERLAALAGLDADRRDVVRVASLLHDIGKVAVPDSVLLKPGALTAEERLVVQRHSEVGATMLAGSQLEVLQVGAIVAGSHHERWDGGGYPRGLRGAQIPLEARLVSVIDVYDALRSERPYKRSFPVEESVELLRAGRGTQFDPELLDLFLDDLMANGETFREQSTGAHGTADRGTATHALAEPVR